MCDGYDDFQLWELAAQDGLLAMGCTRKAPLPQTLNGGHLDLDCLLLDLDAGCSSTVPSTPSVSSHASPYGKSLVSRELPSPLRSPVEPGDDLLRDLLPGLPQPVSCGRERACRGWLRAEDPTPSPRRDNRPPIEDDYDVVAAIADFEQAFSSDRGELTSKKRYRVEAVQMTIRRLKLQAERLSVSIANESTPQNVKSHYAGVRQELLGEAHSLEETLEEEEREARRPCSPGRRGRE